jgi:serine-type D-Ala-D-Ala carboxypeptidase/endopeptidase
MSSTINSVLGSPSTNISNSSSYPISNFSPSTLSTAQSKNNNLTSTFEITDQIKALIDERLDKNKTNAAIVIGFIDPNGTQLYAHGKMSNSSNATVDENTLFSIGSTTKVFTTILLADMVDKGLVKLDDPIEKYLPSYVAVPQYKDHKITIEDLATHRSGLPEFPGNYCPSFDPAKTAVVDSVQYRKDLMNCTKNYTLTNFIRHFLISHFQENPVQK